jgi:uncharacterized glyoxalase superfamily protein PhnB
MKVLAMSVVRHTQNFEAMIRFYHEILEMKIVESWNEPRNQGALLSPGEKVDAALIEILQLGDQAKPGLQPENIVLSIEIDDVDGWHDHLSNLGVIIARRLEDAPWGHRGFSVDDPDGFRIRFYQDITGR